jgi:gamma-glutamyltranspeptidase/glutathione hydrolase
MRVCFSILFFLIIIHVDAQFKSDLEGVFFDRPLISGQNGMVTSLHPLSSMAGIQILMRGGNAFDAAVATALATTVVDPKNSTIGGNGFATMYIAASKEVKALNFFGPAPKAATIERYKDKDYKRGFLASPVPSNLKGYQAILETYGTMSWEEVLEPAIALAENGYLFTQNDTEILEERAEILTKYPTTKAIFFPNGAAIKDKAAFVQKDLASTLKAIAKEGPDVFYKGRIADEIISFYQAHGGLFTKEDLANYEAKWLDI